MKRISMSFAMHSKRSFLRWDGVRLSLAFPVLLGLLAGILFLKVTCRILLAEPPAATAPEVPASGDGKESCPEKAPREAPCSGLPTSGEAWALPSPAVFCGGSTCGGEWPPSPARAQSPAGKVRDACAAERASRQPFTLEELHLRPGPDEKPFWQRGPPTE